MSEVGAAHTRRPVSRRGAGLQLLKTAVLLAAIVLLRRHRLPQYLVVTALLLDALVARARRRGVAPRIYLAELGFGRRGAGAHTSAGFALGACVLSAAVGILWLQGWYRPRTSTLTGRAAGKLVYFVALFLVVAVLEELIARGLLFRWLERRGGSWAALAGSSMVFGLGHLPNPNASVVAGVAIAVEAGVLLGAAYLLTRTLWFPIGIHWAWNLFEGPVWGTPVSGLSFRGIIRARVDGPELWTGGAFGPEAGLAAMLAGTVAGAALLVAAVRRGRLVGRAAA